MMEKLSKVGGFFKGKKTYIIGVLMIILGLLQGDSQLAIEGFAFVALRAGVSNK